MNRGQGRGISGRVTTKRTHGLVTAVCSVWAGLFMPAACANESPSGPASEGGGSSSGTGSLAETGPATDDTGTSTHGPDGETTTGSSSGGADDDPSGACVTETPCASNSDCAGLPGTRCNRALATPRCARLQCGASGTPCSDAALCELGHVCVDPEQSPGEAVDPLGVCLDLDAARSVCVAACQSAPPTSPLGVCAVNEAQILCNYACGLYPEDPGWPCGDAFAFVSRDCGYSPVDPPSCHASLDCPGVGATAIELFPCE